MHSLKWLPLRGKGDGLFVHQLWRVVGWKLLWAWVGPSWLWQTAAVFSSRKVQTLAPGNQQEHSKKSDGGDRGIDDICCTHFLKESQLMNLFWNFQWVSKTTFLDTKTSFHSLPGNAFFPHFHAPDFHHYFGNLISCCIRSHLSLLSLLSQASPHFAHLLKGIWL